MINSQKTYTLDDLPFYSSWPARLLGLTGFSPKTKSNVELLREYEMEKWKPLLEKISSDSSVENIEIVDATFIGQVAEILYCQNSKFHLSTNIRAHQDYIAFVKKKVLQYIANVTNLLEIGCGYGSVLLNLANDPIFNSIGFNGVEYTESGLALTRMVAERMNLKLKTGMCDITKPKITEISIPQNSLIYTSYVASCIPQLPEYFVDSILKFNPKVVIHFEPCYEHCQELTLLDLLRKRYIDLNDYNTNLMTILEKAESLKKIRIIDVMPNAFGTNPLFCASVIVWEPRSINMHLGLTR